MHNIYYTNVKGEKNGIFVYGSTSHGMGSNYILAISIINKYMPHLLN